MNRRDFIAHWQRIFRTAGIPASLSGVKSLSVALWDGERLVTTFADFRARAVERFLDGFVEGRKERRTAAIAAATAAAEIAAGATKAVAEWAAAGETAAAGPTLAAWLARFR